MIVYSNVVQGSEAWRRLRMGMPTASSFDRIITPKKLELSTQATDYRNELLAELMLGMPLEMITTEAMHRGHQMEDEARKFYEFQTDVDVELVGFCTTDDGRFGASPDGLVGADGLVELKCPKAGTHVRYLLAPGKGVDAAYMPQLQGQMLVTDRQYVDIVSYYPGLPSAVVRVERDEKYIEALARMLNDFCNLLEVGRRQIEAMGWLAEQKAQPAFDPDAFGVTQDDAAAIWAGYQERLRSELQGAM